MSLVERAGDLWGVHLTRYRVLVDGAKAKLVFIPGSSAWSGMLGKVYSPSMLAIIRDDQSMRRRITYLHNGGRLSQAILRAARSEIEADFGREVADRVSVKETVTP